MNDRLFTETTILYSLKPLTSTRIYSFVHNFASLHYDMRRNKKRELDIFSETGMDDEELHKHVFTCDNVEINSLI